MSVVVALGQVVLKVLLFTARFPEEETRRSMRVSLPSPPSAPRNISASDYASAIVDAITRCTHFVVIVSANSLRSNHVLNEIDLAFQELGRQVRLMPLRLDEEEMGAPFRYYLSRQHWTNACVPPLEQRLEEFADAVVQSQ